MSLKAATASAFPDADPEAGLDKFVKYEEVDPRRRRRRQHPGKCRYLLLLLVDKENGCS